MHWQRNNQWNTASGFSGLSSETPGTLLVANTLFTVGGTGLPDNVLTTAFGTENQIVDSIKYELTGPYIENALVGALLTDISRDNWKPMVTEADIVGGCRLQMRGSLQMKTYKHRVVPKIGLDKLILTPNMKENLEAIVTFQKAREVLLGHWGFELDRIGTACLFWGQSGTGKSSAAEAIGYELGRPLKVINCAQLVSKEKKASGSNITSAFRDSQLMDAVLVLDDFQAVAGVGAVSAERMFSGDHLLKESAASMFCQ